MRVSSTTPARSSSTAPPALSLSTLSTLFLAFPSLISALTFDCKDVAASGKHFDFSELKGVHQVHWLGEKDLLHHSQDNFTFVLDLCGGLRKATKLGCHSGARICGINNQIDLATNNITTEARDISGTYTSEVRRPMDPKYELLKNSGSHADVGREGIRAELHGGKYPWKGGVDQMAIIEFVCDKERSGLEGDEKNEDQSGDDKDDDGDKDNGDKEKDDDKDKSDEKRSPRRREDSKCEDSDRSLRFCGYDVENSGKKKQAGVLRLEWRTKYACENAESPGGGSSHWGFFTWFIIILFMAVAAYLIFGSWLNYNRYGARGWDLLPHGDTIRDIPYLLKDFARRVVNTIQGSGSRGGYSAV